MYIVNRHNYIKYSIIFGIVLLFIIAFYHSVIRQDEDEAIIVKRRLGLAAIPTVEIDPKGRFKYILINVIDPLTVNHSKHIVRGYNRFEHHAKIFADTNWVLRTHGLNSHCLGGGRIEHFPELKHIKVYGYSKTYGRANHNETRSLLLTKYTDYTIETSNKGY